MKKIEKGIIITGDGISEVIRTDLGDEQWTSVHCRAGSEEGIDRLLKVSEEVYDLDPKHRIRLDRPSTSRSFGPASKWRAAWEPTGPKPPYYVEPKKPAIN